MCLALLSTASVSPRRKAHPQCWNFLRGTLPGTPILLAGQLYSPALFAALEASSVFLGNWGRTKKTENLGNLRRKQSPGWNKKLWRCSPETPFTLFFLIYFYFMSIGVLPACMSVWGCQIPETGRLWAAMWLLGSELGSSGRTANGLNYWAISPAPKNPIYEKRTRTKPLDNSSGSGFTSSDFNSMQLISRGTSLISRIKSDTT